jgi:hypothetical protein
MGLIGVLAVCGLVGGCSKSSDDPVQPIPLVDLPAAVAKALCDSVASCCQRSRLAFDVTSCRASASARYGQLIAPDSSNVVYDAQAGGNCVAEVQADAQCGVVRDDGAVNACDHLFVGQVPLGGNCTSSNECKRPAKGLVRCASAGGIDPVPGVCTLVQPTQTVRGGAGQSCFADCSGSDCSAVYFDGFGSPNGAVVLCYRADGLFCNENGVCQGLVKLGESCHDYNACAGSAFCDMQTARCLSPLANGSVCELDEACKSQDCTNGICGGGGNVDPLVCASDDLPN